MRQTYVANKMNIVNGVPQLHIEWAEPRNERLILPNGVYVPVGERPDNETLQRLVDLFGFSKFYERSIPSDQSTSDVLLGAMIDYGISPVTTSDINTEHVNNCHILVATGIANNQSTPTAEVAIFAHINPAAHTLNTNNFNQRLRERIRDLRDATHQYTQDILIAGGCIDYSNERRFEQTMKFCLNSIYRIATSCDSIDLEPTVTRPGLQPLDTHMSLQTQSRKLIIRPSFAPKVSIPEEFIPSVFLLSETQQYFDRLRNAMNWTK